MAPRPNEHCALLPRCGAPSQRHTEDAVEDVEKKEEKEEKEMKERKDASTRRDTGVELANDFRCSEGEYTRAEVQASRGQFNWKVVEPYDGAAAEDWVSWDSVGMADNVEWKHRVVWRNCTDISHAWTGMVSLLPGQQEPYHTHGHPMFYFILQVHQYISTSFQWITSIHILLRALPSSN